MANINFKVKNGLEVNGDVDVTNHRITNVATPTAGTDAATKAYTDSSSSTVTTALTTHISDATKHLTTSQNTWIDAITASSAEVNQLVGVTSGIQSQIDAKIPLSEKGAANGVATLGTDGKVPATQLPSYVDDVMEYANLAALPVTGNAGKIYVTQDTNKIYRWSGSAYIEISPTAGNADSATKLATARTISATGDAAWSVSFDGSANATSALTLSNSGVTAGVYGSSTAVPVLTLDAKGRVTSATTASISGSLTFTGDVTGSGSTGTSTTLTLSNSGVTAGTYKSVTVDTKGRVTAGTNPTTLAGYGITDAAPLSHTSDQTVHLTSTQNDWIDAITASSTEVNYLVGVTSSVQTQINGKVAKTGDTMSGNLLFSNSALETRGVQGQAGTNDFWFVGGGATASDAGFMEIATGDNGTEPIYVRQYSGGGPLTPTSTLVREAVLLNSSGNTVFPGSVTATSFVGPTTASGYGITDVYTKTESDGRYVRPDQNNLYTAAQRGAVSTITPAASIVLNLALSNNFTLTLNTATTLANPTNVVAGQSGAIVVRQDATGSRTLNFGSYWLFPNRTTPILTTTANAIDMISYYVISPTEIIVTMHFNIGR